MQTLAQNGARSNKEKNQKLNKKIITSILWWKNEGHTQMKGYILHWMEKP